MKKDIKFSTQMASEDRQAIKELAKRSRMSMSDYVTACCLGKQVVVIDGLKEVLKELKSIGRNLNQLVTLAHMGRVTVVNLDSVRQAFSVTLCNCSVDSGTKAVVKDGHYQLHQLQAGAGHRMHGSRDAVHHAG